MKNRREFLVQFGALALTPSLLRAEEAKAEPIASTPPTFNPEHVICEPCIGVKDTACVDVCPVDCIYGKNEDWDQLFIHPEECIDCGLCVDACPVEAIYPKEEVPDK